MYANSVGQYHLVWRCFVIALFPQVTSGARGIAYSCLLDCLCAGNQHRKGWEALQVTSDAIKLDLSTYNEIEAESRLGLCYISQGQNNFAHWSTQTFYLNAIKIYLLLACKMKQNGALLVCLLIVYMSHIKVHPLNLI